MGRYTLANSNNKVDIVLSLDQIEAIEDRDMIRAIKLGIGFNTYMSCIDPDYPRILG